MSALSQHLAQPGGALPEFEEIEPRISDFERTLAGNRDSILEAARQAAESAVRSFSGSKSDSAAVLALAEDLKSLDELARRSDERNTKTFEAIHDTLLKIVNRLGSLEDRRLPVFAEPIEPARKMALRDAPSIAPDDDMRIAPEIPARAQPSDMTVRAQPGEMRDVAPVTRTPAEAAAEAAVAALDSDEATAVEAPAPWTLDVRWTVTRIFRKETARGTGDDRAAGIARHGHAGAGAGPRRAARPEGRQPSVRAGIGHT